MKNNLKKINYEILVCGPSDFDPTLLLKEFHGANIKYIQYDFPIKPRIIYTRKKNFIFQEAEYSIISISHTRIKFSSDFAEKILCRRFDSFTPAIISRIDGKEYKYNDFGLIGSYDLYKKSPRINITSKTVEEDYLHLMKKRVPYIDGGLIILNKNEIELPPFDNFLAWGEAEDVDLCQRLYFGGFLIDFFFDLRCESEIPKWDLRTKLWKEVLRSILKRLIKKGVL